MLDAAYDLGGIAGCYLLIGLLAVVAFTFERLAQALDVSILGFRPFSSIASSIRNVIVAGCDDGIKALEKGAAGFESGLIDSFGIIIGLAYLLGKGVKAALEYLWSHALRPLINSLLSPVRSLATQAVAKIESLATTVAHNLTRAESYAAAQATKALGEARTYANLAVNASEDALYQTIAQDVARLDSKLSAGITGAEKYADLAVDKLRAAEQSAIAHAVSIATDAQRAVTAAERAAVATAEEEATLALRASEVAATSALDQVRAVAVAAERDIGSLVGGYGLAGAAGLIASIPALATLVNTIATETGLENQSCRAKVKNVCQTDATQWENLLGGLAVAGIAFNLRELAKVAEEILGGLAVVIREAA